MKCSEVTKAALTFKNKNEDAVFSTLQRFVGRIQEIFM
jgi:hypothetical protein